MESSNEPAASGYQPGAYYQSPPPQQQPPPAQGPSGLFYVLVLATIVMVFAIGGIFLKRMAAPQRLVEGPTAPDFRVISSDGRPISLSDFRGRVVVLDFWATWCGPCRASLPDTAQLAADYRLKNVIVLAINVSDTPQNFSDWVSRHPEQGAIHFAIDTRQDDRSVGKAYGVATIPNQWVIDQNGKVVGSDIFPDGESQVRQIIDQALATK